MDLVRLQQKLTAAPPTPVTKLLWDAAKLALLTVTCNRVSR